MTSMFGVFRVSTTSTTTRNGASSTPNRRARPALNPWDAAGNAWTFVTLDADSKLLVLYLVSHHKDTRSAVALLGDVADPLEKRPRITADELTAYRKAVKQVVGKKARFTLSQTRKGENHNHNTAYVKHHNLTIPTSNRRFSRHINPKFPGSDKFQLIIQI